MHPKIIALVSVTLIIAFAAQAAGQACPEGERRDCGSDTGACEKGVQFCIDGVWGSCEGSLGPSPEKCDGKDNDCNGETDETGGCCTAGQVKPCGSSIGTCKTGVRKCENNVWSENCYDQTEPGEEICSNGFDDDCDGQADETDCMMNPAEKCGVGPIINPCLCGAAAYRAGFCCNGMFNPVPCPSYIPGIPASDWNFLILAGLALMVVMAFMAFRPHHSYN